MSRDTLMPGEKQRYLPLWGSTPNAAVVHINAVRRLDELLWQFRTAEAACDEAAMDEAVTEMRHVISRVEHYKRAKFKQWAKERAANRS
jgi:hypothetical protein